MEVISGPVSIKKIFLCQEAWIHFWIKYALRLRWAILYNVVKMLSCRSGLGYSRYICPGCGETKKIYHTCKSRFCSSCGKAYADKWSEESLNALLDVSYKHLFFTIPEELRIWFSYNKKLMPQILFTAVRTALLKYCKDRNFVPGMIMALHSFGSALKHNPHIHVIITAGGLSLDNTKWIPQYVIPHSVIKPMYQYNFLKLMSKNFRDGKLNVPKEHRHIKTPETFESYLTQFHRKKWYVGLGESLKEAASKVKYIARYTRRPVVAESKLKNFDEKTVTVVYVDKTTNRKTEETFTVEEFIKGLVTHIPEQNFKIIRNSGIFSNRTKGEKLPLARQALNMPKPTFRENKTTYRKMYYQAYGIDPLQCPKCKKEMLLYDHNIVPLQDLKSDINEKHASILSHFYKAELAGFP